jgi:hypothetical protein
MFAGAGRRYLREEEPTISASLAIDDSPDLTHNEWRGEDVGAYT